MEETKPLLFKGDANNNSRWRKNALVSTALLLGALVAFAGVHFVSRNDASSSFAKVQMMGSSKGRMEDQKMKPNFASKEAKLGEEENDEDSDVPKPANNEETEVVDTEDDEKVDKLVEEEEQLAEKVDGNNGLEKRGGRATRENRGRGESFKGSFQERERDGNGRWRLGERAHGARFDQRGRAAVLRQKLKRSLRRSTRLPKRLRGKWTTRTMYLPLLLPLLRKRPR